MDERSYESQQKNDGIRSTRKRQAKHYPLLFVDVRDYNATSRTRAWACVSPPAAKKQKHPKEDASSTRSRRGHGTRSRKD